MYLQAITVPRVVCELLIRWLLSRLVDQVNFLSPGHEAIHLYILNLPSFFYFIYYWWNNFNSGTPPHKYETRFEAYYWDAIRTNVDAQFYSLTQQSGGAMMWSDVPQLLVIDRVIFRFLRVLSDTKFS